ncbi:hypothetical protein ILYODFUR_018105 [Ilyodon furcidens]|uniref:Glutaredoxin domain-containing protein n=1 Tax=Ilyodon furcidens TaxID=33524 RepID=A0ABV0UV96_9TELE
MGDFESGALGRVTVYSIQGCPHCVQAKATLRSLGVPVFDVDVGIHSELMVKLKELTGRSTVPQIFFNTVHVGGNEDLQKLAPEELQRLVTLVKEEPLSADAPPLPENNPFEVPGGEIDGGKQFTIKILLCFSDYYGTKTAFFCNYVFCLNSLFLLC